MTIEKLSKMIEISSGKVLADLVIRNCKVVDPISSTITDADIAISDDYIVGVGSYNGKEVIDAKGSYATSGLIDSHVHIESSLCTPASFAEVAIPFGTTLIITDPHEIANVCGIEGIKFMINSAKKSPLKCKFMLSSCVPAVGFEDSGAILDADTIEEFINDDNIFGLAEMMNAQGVLSLDREVLRKLIASINAGKIIDGHGVMLGGKTLNAYRAAGVYTDHECVSAKDLKARIANGMYVLLRQGSAAQNLASLLQGVNQSNARRCAMCTDDKHLDDIMKYGHISHNLKIAVEHGLDVFNAIAMATINAAECYGLKDIGLIASGYKADIVLFDDLKDFKANKVFIDGKLVSENGHALFKTDKDDYNDNIFNTVNIAPITVNDIQIKLKTDEANVIRIVNKDLITEKSVRIVGFENGYFKYRKSVDILKLVVAERHKRTGKIGLGLIENYKLKNGAIATSVSHDSHNIIAVGDNDEDIILAIKQIEKCSGGITIVKNGKVLDTLELKIAGIMSNEMPSDIVKKIYSMHELAYNELNVNRDIDPFMTLSFMALPVIPEIKLTTNGLFDVKEFKFIDVSA
ncbi:adenine deaminase [Brachyspira murdochii]|uniref:adenine deaminase n=1 Tax=Brachyspira murdochii TaxID=84378 RepID=UPI0012F4C7D8|nr:adenine deaminase [Brachyspira murdochii]